MGSFEIFILPGNCICYFFSDKGEWLQWATGDLEQEGWTGQGRWELSTDHCLLLRFTGEAPGTKPVHLCVENGDVALVFANDQRTPLERVLAHRSIEGRCAVLP
jgi:hypothetical protein